jgi:hypothetical protein
MTRAEWYRRQYGGTWRTARVAHRCDCKPHPFPRCRNKIEAGAKYFDSGDVREGSTSRHATKRFCEECANEQLRLN